MLIGSSRSIALDRSQPKRVITQSLLFAERFK
jgi:hypothetical protein